MMPILSRFRMIPLLLRSGRLAVRLFRDARTPLYAKVLLGAAVLYALSPIDLLPDLIPILGQVDDVAVLALGLEMFFKLTPDWLVAEHESALGQTRKGSRIIDL